MRISLPLRYSISISLGILALLLTAQESVFNWLEEKQQIETQTLLHATALSSIVVPQLEDAMLRENISGAKNAVSRVSVLPELSLAVVCDNADRVVVSTDFKWLNRNISQTPAAMAEPLLARARKSMRVQSEIPPGGDSVLVAFPFHLGTLPGEMRPSRVAVFYIQMDLRAQKQQALTNIGYQAAAAGFCALLGCILVWLYLRHTFTRHLDKLVRNLAAYSADSQQLPIPAEGNDELSQIGKAMNQTLAALAAQHAALQQSEQSTRRLNRNLQILQTAVASLASAKERDEVLGIVRTAARNLTGADGMAFILREGGECHYTDEDGITPGWKGRRIPMSECFSGRVMQNGKFEIIGDVAADPRILSRDFLAKGIQSMTAGPIGANDPIGAIALFWTRTRTPSSDELLLLRSLTDATAVALQNIQAYEILERRVQERTAEALALYNNAPCGYHSVDARGGIIQINDTELQWLGYEREEIEGRIAYRQLVAPEMRDALLEKFEAFQTQDEAVSFELGLIAKDGSIIWTICNSKPFRDKDGNFIRSQTALLNITEHKKLAGALQESEEKYRVIFESSRDAIIVTDAAGRCLDCNPAAVKMFACADKSELLARGPAGFTPPVQPDGRDSRLAFAEVMAQVMTKSNLFVEWQHQRADGTQFPAEVSLTAVHLHGRAVVHGLVRDISQRKRDTAILRQLSQAVEFSPSMIMITDPAGRVEYVNPSWEKCTGYRLEEVRGNKPKALRSGVHSSEFYQAMWGEITAGQVWRGEFCNRRRNGELYWESAAIAPLREDNGSISHFVAVKEDITKARQAAEELRQAKDAADAANRAKSVFLANMSHEIRTPMNAILGFSQLMQRNPDLTPSLRQQLATIMRSGAHLLEIINDILEMARIESGKLTLNTVPFDLGLMVKNLEQMFAERARAKGLGFHVHCEDHLPRGIITDETKVRQVFINLLGNALKFTSSGEIILRVSTRAQTDGKLRVSAEVEDTGPGIADEDKTHLFEPFFQTRTGRETPGGTGLGLAISREFLHLMGGDLEVQSQVGKGSIFRLHFQAQITDESSIDSKMGESRVVCLHPESPRCKVLVADDEPVNRRLLEQMLAPLGFEVWSVANGKEAVAACGSFHPDLVLMDLKMPVMDGYEATEQIRARHGGKVKIIALTASAFKEDRQRSLESGANGFFIKPFRQEELLELIKELTSVKYLYEDGESAPATPAIPSFDATKLPADLVAKLASAMARVDYDEMLALTDRIAETDAAAGRAIRDLIESFDYGTLQQLLRARPE